MLLYHVATQCFLYRQPCELCAPAKGLRAFPHQGLLALRALKPPGYCQLTVWD